MLLYTNIDAYIKSCLSIWSFHISQEIFFNISLLYPFDDLDN